MDVGRQRHLPRGRHGGLAINPKQGNAVVRPILDESRNAAEFELASATEAARRPNRRLPEVPGKSTKEKSFYLAAGISLAASETGGPDAGAIDDYQISGLEQGWQVGEGVIR
jgi:hypothetical protein